MPIKNKTSALSALYLTAAGIALVAGHVAAQPRDNDAPIHLSKDQIQRLYEKHIGDSFAQNKIGIPASAEEQARVTQWITSDLSNGPTNVSRLSKQWVNANGHVFVVSGAVRNGQISSYVCASEGSYIKALFRVRTSWDQGAMPTVFPLVLDTRIAGLPIDLVKSVNAPGNCPDLLRRLQFNYNPPEFKNIHVP